jgi:hypothetical protein
MRNEAIENVEFDIRGSAVFVAVAGTKHDEWSLDRVEWFALYGTDIILSILYSIAR